MASSVDANGNPLTFGQFWSLVVAEVRIGSQAVDAETRLREDLGLDSLQMLELVLVMYDLGAELPEEYIPYMQKAGDLYDHYLTRTEAEPRT